MRLFRLTLTYKILNTFRCLYFYISDWFKIHSALYSDGFKSLLERYLETEMHKDWLGRLYGVINPVINKNGEFDMDRVIMEMNGDATNNDDQVKHWVFQKMNIIGRLFKMQNLYDYISLEIRHIGPVQFDNYLVVFDITARRDFSKAFKKMILQTFIYCIIAGMVLLIFL